MEIESIDSINHWKFGTQRYRRQQGDKKSLVGVGWNSSLMVLGRTMKNIGRKIIFPTRESTKVQVRCVGKKQKPTARCIHLCDGVEEKNVRSFPLEPKSAAEGGANGALLSAAGAERALMWMSNVISRKRWLSQCSVEIKSCAASLALSWHFIL